MASTADFRTGLVLNWKNGIWKIQEFQHVKPGKGPAFVRAKLKNIRNDKIVETTFRAGEKVDTIRLERREMQYLYEDEVGYHVMNSETYEQTVLRPEMVRGKEFVTEGSTVEVLVNAGNEEPLSVEIPKHVELAVARTDPGLKGDTATGATKPATLEGGAEIQVPLFINEDDTIRVDTETGEYQART